jgi:hypothetical protein
MDSFQHYFNYSLGLCICGIPEIQIKGTKDDWIRLKEKMTNILKEFSELTVWSEKSIFKIIVFFKIISGVPKKKA